MSLRSGNLWSPAVFRPPCRANAAWSNESPGRFAAECRVGWKIVSLTCNRESRHDGCPPGSQWSILANDGRPTRNRIHAAGARDRAPDPARPDCDLRRGGAVGGTPARRARRRQHHARVRSGRRALSPRGRRRGAPGRVRRKPRAQAQLIACGGNRRSGSENPGCGRAPLAATWASIDSWGMHPLYSLCPATPGSKNCPGKHLGGTGTRPLSYPFNELLGDTGPHRGSRVGVHIDGSATNARPDAV